MDYSQKKGFSSGFEQGVKIGSSGAEKRLDMIAKTKEKEQELADKIKGQERIAQFIESEMGNKSGADFIRSLPTAEVSTGIGLLLKSKGEEPSLAEKILAKQYGINLGTTTGNTDNTSLTNAVSSQNNGVSSTTPSQVEPSAETSTVPDMRIESVTAGGVTMKPVKTEKEKQEELQDVVEKQKATTAATKEAERQAKLVQLRSDINNVYFPVANNIPTINGSWIDRKKFAAELWLKGKNEQGTPVGAMVTQLDSLNKRLRVTLVRAAGDVGNLNIVEQKAAEELLFRLDDSTSVRELKKAVLQDLAAGVQTGDSSYVKKLIDKWVKSPEYKESLINSGEENPFDFNNLEEAEKAGLPDGAVVRLPDGSLKRWRK